METCDEIFPWRRMPRRSLESRLRRTARELSLLRYQELLALELSKRCARELSKRRFQEVYRAMLIEIATGKLSRDFGAIEIWGKPSLRQCALR